MWDSSSYRNEAEWFQCVLSDINSVIENNEVLSD